MYHIMIIYMALPNEWNIMYTCSACIAQPIGSCVRTKIINRMTKAMETKANEAYGPVSSSQPPPPPASEGAYNL